MSPVRLVCVAGRQAGAEFDVAQRTVVGRDGHAADIVLDDSSVSRRHAQLTTADGTLTIVDLGSTNGTSVNGRRIGEARRVAPGDRLQIGSTVLELRSTLPETQIGTPAAAADRATLVEHRSPSQPRPPPVTAPPHATHRRHAHVRNAAAALVVALVALLIAAQLVLPGIAADRIRHRLQRDGAVARVEVYAFPAVRLLWRSADDVRVDLQRYDATRTSLADLIDDAGAVKRLRATVERLAVGPMRMQAARLTKDGEQLTAEATIAPSVLSDLAPPGFGIQPLARDGQLGYQGAKDGVGGFGPAGGLVTVRQGGIVVEPDVPFAGSATVSVFDDERVTVDRVTARRGRSGITVSVQGRVR